MGGGGKATGGGLGGGMGGCAQVSHLSMTVAPIRMVENRSVLASLMNAKRALTLSVHGLLHLCSACCIFFFHRNY